MPLIQDKKIDFVKLENVNITNKTNYNEELNNICIIKTLQLQRINLCKSNNLGALINNSSIIILNGIYYAKNNNIPYFYAENIKANIYHL